MTAIGPIAGLVLRHTMDAPVTFRDLPGTEWRARDDDACDITVRHMLGSTSVDGLVPSLEVGEHATYYSDRDGSPAVMLRQIIPGVERVLLRTVLPGHEYEARYSAAPTSAVPRVVSELPAYTLALSARRGGVIAHGCGFVLPGGGLALCLGVSGAGKSTLGRLLAGEPGVRVLNDDRIVLTMQNGGIHAWSTPWPGRGGQATVGDAPLAVVALIGRATERRVSAIRGRQAIAALLQTIAIPLWEGEASDHALELVGRLEQDVPIVRLEYPLETGTDAWIATTLRSVANGRVDV